MKKIIRSLSKALVINLLLIIVVVLFIRTSSISDFLLNEPYADGKGVMTIEGKQGPYVCGTEKNWSSWVNYYCGLPEYMVFNYVSEPLSAIKIAYFGPLAILNYPLILILGYIVLFIFPLSKLLNWFLGRNRN